MPARTFASVGSDEIPTAWADEWGEFVVSEGRIYRPGDVEGLALVAEDGRRLALVTWAIHGDAAEIVSLNAFQPGHGYGREVLTEAERRLAARGIARLWLITTNDNLQAIGVYLRAGWRLTAVHLDAMDAVRALKPHIPLVGEHSLPLRDEWRFEKEIDGPSSAHPLDS